MFVFSLLPYAKYNSYRLRIRFVGFGIDDLKVCLGILVVFVYKNSSPQLFESEEHSLDT